MSNKIPEAIKNQKIWLDKLQEISKKPILVKIKEGATPEGADYDLYNWNYYKDIWSKVKEPIYTRGILAHELCFDPDVKNWKLLKEQFSHVLDFLKKEQIPYYLYYSGGDGIHCSIFFDTFGIDESNFNDAKTYELDLYKIVRKALIDIILYHSNINKMVIALDPKKISFSKNRMGSQIRECGTMRPNGNYKTLITEIPEERPKPGSLPLIFPEKVIKWVIPEKHNKEINQKIRDEIIRSKHQNEYNFDAIDFHGNELSKFPCLKTLLKTGAKTGSRYPGSNSICLMAKKCGYSWKTTEEAIRKFFSKCDITLDEIELKVTNNKSLYEGDYHFSCAEIKEIFGRDICKFSNCVLREKVEKMRKESRDGDGDAEEEIPEYIREKARKIQQDENPVKFIIEQYNKTHIGDIITGKTILAAIGTQSIINSDGIQPKLSAESGKGKSHAVASILHLVPHDYILETSLSGKALFHMPDIKPGTIIFSDDTEPDESLQEVIKRSSTNFQKTTNHTISIKDGAEWTTKTKKIPPRTVWCLTSVNDTGSMEFLNRQLNLGVDESMEQDSRVMNFILGKAVTGEIQFPVTDDVLVCREILHDIKTKLFRVMIPYAQRIKWNDTENRRNLPQFLDLIRGFAVLDYIHRVRIDDTTIEASTNDFNIALSLYSTRAINQRLKLNDQEIEILKQMKVGIEYTIQELQVASKKSYQSIYYLFHGRDRRSGLLSKVPGLTYKPETLFLGQDEISGEGEDESTYTVMKKTKPKHVYVLTTDLHNLLNFGSIAELEPESKS